jgi:hypothetical protein
MYNYKTQNQLAREKRQEQVLFFSLGLGLGFALACLVVFFYI